MQGLVQMVKLRAAGLSRGYRRSLKEAGLWLLQVVQSLGGSLGRDDPPHVVDRWLERAVEEAFKSGEKFYMVNLGLVAIQRSFRLSAPLLRGAWSAMRGWRALRPVRSRVPITRYRLECLLVCALARGWGECRALRRRWWACAVAWWLGFVCLLRPGELLGLRCGDVSLPEGDQREVEELGAVIIIRKPKTRRVWREQFVVCADKTLVQWLRWWIAGSSRGKPLFNISRYHLASCFKALCNELGLAACGYTLSALRSGGATDHFQRHRNLGELQYLGRWKQASTLQFYLHEAYAIHVTRQQERGDLCLLEAAHSRVQLLSTPPNRSLSLLLQNL